MITVQKGTQRLPSMIAELIKLPLKVDHLVVKYLCLENERKMFPKEALEAPGKLCLGWVRC